MSSRKSDSIRKIANFVGKNSFFKKLFRPIYSKYLDGIAKKENKVFRQNAIHVISIFDKCLSDNGLVYSLVFGSMLGAIREHGFIKHDLDIDVAMWIEDYSPQIQKELNKYGFRLAHTLTVENGELAREETYSKDGISIDIFYIYPPLERMPYCCTFYYCDGCVSFEHSVSKCGYVKVRRLEMPWKKEIIKVPFENIELPIMTNSKELLKITYGNDYMTPNPRWTPSRENNYAVIWKDVKGVYNSFE